MTNSEPRSPFELSQKLRPRNADRFKKTCPVSKNRVISPKNGVTTNTSLVGSQSQSRSDLHGPICGSLSWRRPCQSPFLVFVYKRRAQKGYRRLPTSSSNHELNTIMGAISCIVFALIITINISCTGSPEALGSGLRPPRSGLQRYK